MLIKCTHNVCSPSRLRPPCVLGVACATHPAQPILRAPTYAATRLCYLTYTTTTPTNITSHARSRPPSHRPPAPPRMHDGTPRRPTSPPAIRAFSCGQCAYRFWPQRYAELGQLKPCVPIATTLSTQPQNSVSDLGLPPSHDNCNDNNCGECRCDDDDGRRRHWRQQW